GGSPSGHLVGAHQPVCRRVALRAGGAAVVVAPAAMDWGEPPLPVVGGGRPVRRLCRDCACLSRAAGRAVPPKPDQPVCARFAGYAGLHRRGAVLLEPVPPTPATG